MHRRQAALVSACDRRIPAPVRVIDLALEPRQRQTAPETLPQRRIDAHVGREQIARPVQRLLVQRQRTPAPAAPHHRARRAGTAANTTRAATGPGPGAAATAAQRHRERPALHNLAPRQALPLLRVFLRLQCRGQRGRHSRTRARGLQTARHRLHHAPPHRPRQFRQDRPIHRREPLPRQPQGRDHLDGDGRLALVAVDVPRDPAIGPRLHRLGRRTRQGARARVHHQAGRGVRLQAVGHLDVSLRLRQGHRRLDGLVHREGVGLPGHGVEARPRVHVSHRERRERRHPVGAHLDHLAVRRHLPRPRHRPPAAQQDQRPARRRIPQAVGHRQAQQPAAQRRRDVHRHP